MYQIPEILLKACHSEGFSPKNLIEVFVLSCADGGRFGGKDGGRFGGKATQTSRTLRSLIIC